MEAHKKGGKILSSKRKHELSSDGGKLWIGRLVRQGAAMVGDGQTMGFATRQHIASQMLRRLDRIRQHINQPTVGEMAHCVAATAGEQFTMASTILENVGEINTKHCSIRHRKDYRLG